MTQYWIEVPVENAKEVVQRKVDEISSNAGIIVSYDEQCEVVLYQNEWNNWSDDRDVIYFGSFFVSVDATQTTSIEITLDNNLGSYLFFDWNTYPPDSGEYPCIMFNTFNNVGTLTNIAYFVGYKFSLTYP